MRMVKIIITGISTQAADIHIINCATNEYLDGFLMLDGEKKIVDKIKFLMEKYDTKEIIIDVKRTSKLIFDILKEEKLI
jgi:Na+-translocating ferredoxin:NAD+ oxidoreductase RnfC subunit